MSTPHRPPDPSEEGPLESAELIAALQRLHRALLDTDEALDALVVLASTPDELVEPQG